MKQLIQAVTRLLMILLVLTALGSIDRTMGDACFEAATNPGEEWFQSPELHYCVWCDYYVFRCEWSYQSQCRMCETPIECLSPTSC